jgi:hypothetical protein
LRVVLASDVYLLDENVNIRRISTEILLFAGNEAALAVNAEEIYVHVHISSLEYRTK